MGLKSNKNFIVANAVENILQREFFYGFLPWLLTKSLQCAASCSDPFPAMRCGYESCWMCACE